MFENIKLFLTSDQIKSRPRMFVSLQFCSSRWSATLRQSKIQQFPFLYHRFSSRFVDFPQKDKISFLKDQNLCKILPSYSIILRDYPLGNLHDCIVFGKKRFHRYFLPWIHYFHQERPFSDELLLNNYDETIIEPDKDGKPNSGVQCALQYSWTPA